MFYNNVKKLGDFNPLNVWRLFVRKNRDEECDGTPHKKGTLFRYRSEPVIRSKHLNPDPRLSVSFLHSEEKPESVEEPVEPSEQLSNILMASLHNSVRVSASDPYPSSPNVDADRRSNDTPSSPRENKRKRFTHEISSPNVFSRNKSGRHSLVIESPIIPVHSPVIAWDGASNVSNVSNPETRSRSQADTCSLNSSCSYDSLVEVEPDEKCQIRIGHIVQELISTEKNYIKDLMDILMGYLDPMQDSGMFSEEQLSDIFINIREIGSFHVEFLELLDKHQEELDTLANCFLSDSADKGFSLYTEFCAKVPSSLAIVESLMSIEENKQFLTQCQHSLHHFFQFSEFLHRPIQRVLKYPLLLRDLVKYTDGTKYWRSVDAALDKITAVAVHINKVKRVQELYSNELVGWNGEPLLSYGVLLLEDLFRINGSRDCRHIFLFEKLFLITKKKDEKYHYKTHLCPSEIAMTENLHGEQCKWEVFRFGDKKNKHVIQASDPQKKQAWVREMKRCILESETELSPQQREILLNEVPTLVNNDFMLDDFIQQNYQGLIPVRPDDALETFDHTLVACTPEVNTPERRNSPHINSPQLAFLSPSNTPSPLTNRTPSPDAQHNNDSGFEDPTPKNHVDYSSLDVKAIKARWIMQEKTNTLPVRSNHATQPLNFHRPSTEKKPETWPCPENKQEVEELMKSNLVSSLKDTVFNNSTSSPPVTYPPPETVTGQVESSTKEEASTKPCLARISHLGKEEKKVPIYRDILSLIEADAVQYQGPEVDLVQVDGPKPSTAADRNINKVESPINQKKKLPSPTDDLVLSESEEFVVKFRKDCNISGTETTKRNSTIIDKEFHKDMALFSPASSDSEYMSDRSETSARVERIKKAHARLKSKVPPLEKTDTQITPDDSLGDLVNQFDEEMTRVREAPADDCHVQDIELSSQGSGHSRNASIDGSTLTRNLTLTRQVDDDTLTKQSVTTDYYMGSSLIRGSPDGEEVVMRPETSVKPKQKRVSKLQAPGKPAKSPVDDKKSKSQKAAHSSTDEEDLPVVMKPKRSSVTPRVSQTKLSRKKSDTTDDDTEKPKRGTRSRKTEPSPSTLQKMSTSTLQKSGSNKALQKSPSGKLIQKSPSNKSIQKSSSNKSIEMKPGRDRTKSGTTGTMARPRPGTSTKTPAPPKPSTPSARTYNKPTASSTAKTSSKATLPRKGSISQDDNPFNSAAAKRAGISKSAPAPKARSMAIPQSSSVLPDKQRTIRSTSDSAKSRQAAYLNAASQSRTTKRISECEPDIVELNNVRSSGMVAKMKTQLQKSNADLKPTTSGRSTVKKKYSRSQTTAITAPRPTGTTRRTSKSYSTPPGSRRHSQTVLQPQTLTRKRSVAQSPRGIVSPSSRSITSPTTRLTRQDTVVKRDTRSGKPSPQRTPRFESPSITHCPSPHSDAGIRSKRRLPEPKSRLDTSRSAHNLPGALSRLPTSTLSRTSLSKSTPGINEAVTRKNRQELAQKRKSVIGMTSERSAIPIRGLRNRDEISKSFV